MQKEEARDGVELSRRVVACRGQGLRSHVTGTSSPFNFKLSPADHEISLTITDEGCSVTYLIVSLRGAYRVYEYEMDVSLCSPFEHMGI